MSSDALFKNRPLIRNATHPRELFTKEELELIRAAVLRKLAFERYSKKPTVKEEEVRAVRELLTLADFNGYYPDVGPDKKLRWRVLCEPYLPKLRENSVVITIRKCEDCGKSFHAHHYPDEEPGDLCEKCDRRATLKAKRMQKREEEIPF